MGLEMVTIDVLLAACNGEAYLPRQLETLKRQLKQDFDVHVLMQDDGSKDGTMALLTQTAQQDKHFAMATEQGRHFGAADNFISLMRQSNAPYAALCDQDDEWQPDRLLQCFTAMQDAEKQLGADTPLLVHSDCCLIDANGKLLHTSFFQHQGWQTNALTLPRLLVQNNATGCTMLMNAALRDLVTTHVQPGQVQMHDWFIALTAAAFGQVLFVDLPLVNYRQHSANAMGASRQGQVARGIQALSKRQQAKERIAITYRHTELFRSIYANDLPQDACTVIDTYLATESMPKWQRIPAVLRGGYTMQSPITRAGQIIFG